MAKIEKIGNIQIVDNKEDKFFYFPMISMACTGSGYEVKQLSCCISILSCFLFTLSVPNLFPQNFILSLAKCG